MRIKINGQPIERIEVKEEASEAAAWGVVLIGALACMGWWMLWR